MFRHPSLLICYRFVLNQSSGLHNSRCHDTPHIYCYAESRAFMSRQVSLYWMSLCCVMAPDTIRMFSVLTRISGRMHGLGDVRSRLKRRRPVHVRHQDVTGGVFKPDTGDDDLDGCRHRHELALLVKVYNYDFRIDYRYSHHIFGWSTFWWPAKLVNS